MAESEASSATTVEGSPPFAVAADTHVLVKNMKDGTVRSVEIGSQKGDIHVWEGTKWVKATVRKLPNPVVLQRIMVTPTAHMNPLPDPTFKDGKMRWALDCTPSSTLNVSGILGPDHNPSDSPYGFFLMAYDFERDDGPAVDHPVELQLKAANELQPGHELEMMQWPLGARPFVRLDDFGGGKRQTATLRLAYPSMVWASYTRNVVRATAPVQNMHDAYTLDMQTDVPRCAFNGILLGGFGGPPTIPTIVQESCGSCTSIVGRAES